MNWLRWYVGTVTDAKLHKASRLAHCRRSAVIAAWAAILEEARRHGDSGDIGPVEPSWLAGQIDEPTTKCAAIIRGMETTGLISGNCVIAFSRRQFTSDNSTVRVRKHRAKVLTPAAPIAPGNVSVTRGETDQNRTDKLETRTNVVASFRSEGRNLTPTPEPTRTPAGVGNQPDLDALYYQRGKTLLGPKAGGVLTKLRAACGDNVGAALQVISDSERKECPAEYVAGVIRNKGRNGKPRGDHYARRIYERHGFNEGEAEEADRRADLPLLESRAQGWRRH